MHSCQNLRTILIRTSKSFRSTEKSSPALVAPLVVTVLEAKVRACGLSRRLTGISGRGTAIRHRQSAASKRVSPNLWAASPMGYGGGGSLHTDILASALPVVFGTREDCVKTSLSAS
ncbi:hypothetical protein V491_01339 [Pseudogymnoascus sp. VKM F-3775]|nr:hypothetical protein V491_01339 [Pseudogymnoascus sp. VKM F-3775]